MFTRLVLAAASFLAVCIQTTAAPENLTEILAALDCECSKIDQPRIEAVEAKDRQYYQPESFTIMAIRMREAVKGYHGPTRGSYVLIVEHYADAQVAKKRAVEYDSPEWPERVPLTDARSDKYDVGKSSVRCWGLAHGRDVYLLTTHAAIYSALERRKDSLRDKLTAFLRQKD